MIREMAYVVGMLSSRGSTSSPPKFELIVNNSYGWGVSRGVGGECWTCEPRVSGSSPGAGNLKKLLIWMKIHGLPQKS